MESTEVNKRLRAIYNEVKQIRCNLGNTASSEADTLLLCDPVSGNLVISVVTYSVTNVPTVTYYNPNGTPYVGPTPVNCAGGQLESDPQEICVSGTTSLLQWVVKSNGQPNGSVYYTDLSGAVVAAPGAGTFVFGSCSNTTSLIDSLCLCDDNGGVITSFRRFYEYNPNTDTVVFTGDWLTDLSAPYTPTGTVSDCGDIGAPPQIVQRRIELSGITTWSRPLTVQSMTIKVRRVGSILTPPTITDNAGNITPLYIGDVETWSVLDTDTIVLQGTFTITLNNIGDAISVIYTELL